MNGANTVATFTPSALLTTLATYRIRVLATVTTSGGAPLGTTFTQPVSLAGMALQYASQLGLLTVP